MKKTILAALALAMVSTTGFAAETQDFNQLLQPKKAWWGAVCRNGMWWCSMWDAAPLGAPCYCNIPGYGSFWGWVARY